MRECSQTQKKTEEKQSTGKGTREEAIASNSLHLCSAEHHRAQMEEKKKKAASVRMRLPLSFSSVFPRLANSPHTSPEQHTRTDTTHITQRRMSTCSTNLLLPLSESATFLDRPALFVCGPLFFVAHRVAAMNNNPEKKKDTHDDEKVDLEHSKKKKKESTRVERKKEERK